MYVLMCPCILNPALRARGITSPADRRLFERAIERCRIFCIEIVPLPCPETLYLGSNRAPGTFLERLNTKEFSRLMDRLEKDLRDTILSRGPPLCIIGVNSSPTCGVTKNYYGSTGEGPENRAGRGVFLDRFPEIAAMDVAEFALYRIYIAAPLFSEAEKSYNLQISSLLTEHLFEAYLPQTIGDDTHCREKAAHGEIFRTHLQALARTDTMVAIIDGADADSGTAWEMGYAYARGIPVVALRTDFRTAGQHEQVNLMLEQASRVINRKEELPIVLKSPRCLHGDMFPDY
jgi:nucleoside 2-deoxyribosyltransferase/predicted secreted protein